MSQIEDDDSKPWTEHDLKEAMRRINAGEINVKEAESYYGISPRTLHRQKAIESMRAQLKPEKAKKMKAAATSSAKKDITVLRKPVGISCSSISDVVSLLNEGTEEVKQLLNYECDLIYECKVCKSLFRSLLNFISHKRIYCCDMFSNVHALSDENGNATMASNPAKVEEKFKTKENLREFTSRPFRITCRKDLTSVLKKITSLPSEFVSADPLLHLQTMENTAYALQQALIPKPHVDEPTVESSELSTTDKKCTVSEVESKKETVAVKTQEVSASTSQEKAKLTSPAVALTRNVAKPFTVGLIRKDFKCPLCESRFSTKKSVLRHLKSIHQKSDEQMEKYKLHFAKKKKVLTKAKPTTITSSNVPKQTTATSTSTPIVLISPSAVPSTSSKESATSPTATTKSDLNSHVRTTRKNSPIDEDESSKAEPSSVGPAMPVVSLTQVNTHGRAPKSANGNSQSKKLASVVSQKKVTVPPSSSLCPMSSKKIGIQVRMNYVKDGVNQSTTAASSSSPAGFTVSSELSHSSSSRRNSVVNVNQDENFEVTEGDVLKGPLTRSANKLFVDNILKALLDQHKPMVKDENEDPKSTTTSQRKIAENEISVYCEDCKTAYALNDQRWDSGDGGSSRTFKCALRDCDFRSNSKNDLLPHLSAQHANLSESAFAEVRAIFVAQSSGAGKVCCHRVKSEEQSVENRPRDTTGKARSVPAPNSAATLKRKLKPEPNHRPIKRKMAASLKTESATATTFNLKTSKKTETAAVPLKNTNNIYKKILLKKMGDEKSKPRARKRMIVDTVELRNVIPNGLQTSIEDAPQFVTVRNVKKQNPVLSEMKVASKLPKMKALVGTSVLPLTSGTDLDPATMSEESLKKSVMTIIFGKDMPDENIDANIVDSREKSPSSSSTSSDSGKEKRYGLRAGKPIGPLAKKIVAPLLPESKEDKVLKTQILNRIKSASR